MYITTTVASLIALTGLTAAFPAASPSAMTIVEGDGTFPFSNTSSPSNLPKRLFARRIRETHAYMCTDPGWRGLCSHQTFEHGLCYDMNPKGNFYKTISSFGPDQGTHCYLYTAEDCKYNKFDTKQKYQMREFSWPGLRDVGPEWDNRFLSLSCLDQSGRRR
ncbi:hypothetical protein H2201_004773 [Coniosporium apollinis]|uniref:Cyanovirin-N domain-containing protein n=2 Tax=Coniosporium TaxID=2810619 RepID=A0ABQ9NT80_9PEZI|nr:hypothetical protein H2199_004760 [Cladosporium sp. JES 115]KAJ9665113.1 hypothetical protein H2201_004773 [Coniosporium apollinis]